LLLAPNAAGELEFDVLATHPAKRVRLSMTTTRLNLAEPTLDFLGQRLPQVIYPTFSVEPDPIHGGRNTLNWKENGTAPGYAIEQRKRVPGASWELWEWCPAMHNPDLMTGFSSHSASTEFYEESEFRVIPVDTIPEFPQ
jgi:hypothetical protein